MTPKRREALTDSATWWIVIGVMLVAYAVEQGMPLLAVFAYLPIRWGLARIVAACAPPTEAPQAEDFGYEQGGPPS